ncbi:MAG: PTS sugar transporter subunit IIA [Candidatus Sumerlaeota bacterium]
MQISDLLQEKHIVQRLTSHKLSDLFASMVNHLADLGEIDNRQEIIDHLVEREKLGSTGLMGGYAIPHTYPPHLHETILMVGICPGGLDFKLRDHEPVHVVFLLLGSPDRKIDHIRLLAAISRTIRAPWLHEALLEADSAQEVLQRIHQAEAESFQTCLNA